MEYEKEIRLVVFRNRELDSDNGVILFLIVTMVTVVLNAK